MSTHEIIDLLEDAIDIIDQLEGVLQRLKPGDNITPGVIYQLYNSLVLLREKIVVARMKVSSSLTPSQD
ncbi:hypothetical protein [Desulfurococcus amylolyticus]|uniref:Uncharacterized protein n=1 Tax=Desulfurococcus amylolyticus DSM 16532 TaxID=768672 RepID=I3XQS7_DESAM|nr:hypothetical protein [Desulfurococcus amylolyticus]AFL66301.1 hypothetical protein Desfe_0391 [Desulfurococcus amylolyticus DSM 16532]